MRDKKKAFLSCAIVAAATLLATPAAMASGGGSSSCSASPSIEVAADAYGVPTPCPVKIVLGVPQCTGPNEAAELTGIRYKKKAGASSFDHVATLVTSNNSIVIPSGYQVFTNCKGDPVTQLGYRSCNVNTVKVNGTTAAADFWVVVSGRKLPVDSAMATKSGSSSSSIKCFPIRGLGLTASSDQLIQQVQRVTSQDGCAVDFITDSLTGEVLSAKLTPESIDNNCNSPSLNVDGETINPLNAEEFELTRPGFPGNYGKWKFGEGYVRSGDNSCTTRIIGGRVYTWGAPCPE